MYISATGAISGSHHRLGVQYPLLATTALQSPETPPSKNSTTILHFCIILLLSVSERTFRRGVAIRRYPITFDTGGGRRWPKRIRWEKVRAAEDSKSEEKYGNTTFELQSNEKSRGVSQITGYSPLIAPVANIYKP